MKIIQTTAAVLVAFAAAAAAAHDYKAGAIEIDHPYARPTAAGQSNGGGYMKLVNGGGAADRLVSVSAGVARSVELHEMTMDGNVMRMRQVDGIALQPGQTVELKPGGYHVMFVGLKAPLKAGDTFPMTLKFEKSGEVRVDVKIEAPGAMDSMGGMKH